jgi:uncharacterized protein YndB with AHSA1/START domain
MALYHFRTEIRIDAAPGQVWTVLEDPTAWPAWWRWLLRAQLLEPGRDDGLGARYRFQFKTALPYTLSFESETVRMSPPSLWEARVSGELAGTGAWEVTEQGGGSLIRYTWLVATTKRWMNLLAPVARPAFSWNHALIMRDFATGLGRRLGVRLYSVEHVTVEPGTAGFGQLSPSIRP